jgi:hypothetical protein
MVAGDRARAGVSGGRCNISVSWRGTCRALCPFRRQISIRFYGNWNDLSVRVAIVKGSWRNRHVVKAGTVEGQLHSTQAAWWGPCGPPSPGHRWPTARRLRSGSKAGIELHFGAKMPTSFPR